MKALKRLSRPLVVLLKAIIVANAVAVLVDVWDYVAYARLSPGTDPAETLVLSDIPTAVVGLVQFGLSLAVAVVFLMWIHRLNQNLRALSDQPLRFTPGWAVGLFFIPIMNLYRPYQVVRELWTVGHRDPAAKCRLVGWWWFLWLVSCVLGRLVFRMTMRANDLSSYLAASACTLVSDGLDVVLGVVALVLVARLATAYARNYVECPPVPAA
jgi:hypothetical protein